MMQSAEDRLGNDATENWRLDESRNGRIAIEGEVFAGVMIIVNLLANDTKQMPFAENDVVIQALATKSAHQPFDEWILPG